MRGRKTRYREREVGPWRALARGNQGATRGQPGDNKSLLLVVLTSVITYGNIHGQVSNADFHKLMKNPTQRRKGAKAQRLCQISVCGPARAAPLRLSYL